MLRSKSKKVSKLSWSSFFVVSKESFIQLSFIYVYLKKSKKKRKTRKCCEIIWTEITHTVNSV